jgi:hypothetical protein
VPINYRLGRICLTIKRYPLRKSWWVAWNEDFGTDLTREDAERINAQIQNKGGNRRVLNPKRPIPPGSLRGKKAPRQ